MRLFNLGLGGLFSSDGRSRRFVVRQSLPFHVVDRLGST